MQETVRLTIQQADADDVFSDIVRVNYRHRSKIPAGSICRIKIQGKSVRASARNVGETNILKMDNLLRLKLGVKVGDEVDAQIKPGSPWDEFVWAWHASDPTHRIAARLAVLSVVLGAVGAVLGGMSLFN